MKFLGITVLALMTCVVADVSHVDRKYLPPDNSERSTSNLLAVSQGSTSNGYEVYEPMTSSGLTYDSADTLKVFSSLSTGSGANTNQSPTTHSPTGYSTGFSFPSGSTFGSSTESYETTSAKIKRGSRLTSTQSKDLNSGSTRRSSSKYSQNGSLLRSSPSSSKGVSTYSSSGSKTLNSGSSFGLSTKNPTKSRFSNFDGGSYGSQTGSSNRYKGSAIGSSASFSRGSTSYSNKAATRPSKSFTSSSSSPSKVFSSTSAFGLSRSSTKGYSSSDSSISDTKSSKFGTGSSRFNKGSSVSGIASSSTDSSSRGVSSSKSLTGYTSSGSKGLTRSSSFGSNSKRPKTYTTPSSSTFRTVSSGLNGSSFGSRSSSSKASTRYSSAGAGSSSKGFSGLSDFGSNTFSSRSLFGSQSGKSIKPSYSSSSSFPFKNASSGLKTSFGSNNKESTFGASSKNSNAFSSGSNLGSSSDAFKGFTSHFSSEGKGFNRGASFNTKTSTPLKDDVSIGSTISKSGFFVSQDESSVKEPISGSGLSYSRVGTGYSPSSVKELNSGSVLGTESISYNSSPSFSSIAVSPTSENELPSSEKTSTGINMGSSFTSNSNLFKNAKIYYPETTSSSSVSGVNSGSSLRKSSAIFSSPISSTLNSGSSFGSLGESISNGFSSLKTEPSNSNDYSSVVATRFGSGTVSSSDSVSSENPVHLTASSLTSINNNENSPSDSMTNIVGVGIPSYAVELNKEFNFDTGLSYSKPSIEYMSSTDLPQTGLSLVSSISQPGSPRSQSTYKIIENSPSFDSESYILKNSESEQDMSFLSSTSTNSEQPTRFQGSYVLSTAFPNVSPSGVSSGSFINSAGSSTFYSNIASGHIIPITNRISTPNSASESFTSTTEYANEYPQNSGIGNINSDFSFSTLTPAGLTSSITSLDGNVKLPNNRQNEKIENSAVDSRVSIPVFEDVDEGSEPPASLYNSFTAHFQPNLVKMNLGVMNTNLSQNDTTTETMMAETLTAQNSPQAVSAGLSSLFLISQTDNIPSSPLSSQQLNVNQDNSIQITEQSENLGTTTATRIEISNTPIEPFQTFQSVSSESGIDTQYGDNGGYIYGNH